MATRRGFGETWDGSASLCLIPARGGSVGVPGKNLRLLDGVPLVAHSIRTAQASGVFDHVHVSTDDRAIAQVAAEYGAIPIERPPELAGNEASMAPVVEHAVRWRRRELGVQPLYVFLLQPTSPLRSASDIRQAAALVGESGCDSAVGVFEADDPPQWALRATPEGRLHPIAGWDRYLARRQDLAPRYFDGPVYAIETASYLAGKRFLTGRTRFFVVPRERAVDIDTEFDLMLAEFLLTREREVREHARRSPGPRAVAV